MGLPLRLTLVAVGLALMVYGVGSLTHGWIFPPRYEVISSPHVAADGPPDRIRLAAAVRDGGEVLAVGLVALGAVLTAVGAWPRRRRSELWVVSRSLRLALVVAGLTAVIYGAASLTGGWLGTATPLEQRLFMPLDEAEPIVVYFVERGRMSPAATWEPL